MKGVQLSLFEEEHKSIVILVERPDGTTFEQVVQLKNGEEPKEALHRYQKEVLGDPYAWCTQQGRRIRYLKKDAYLAIDWRYE